MHIASIGIDLGKSTFHLVALGERNKILLRKKFSRPQLLAYTAKLPLSLIGLEACTPNLCQHFQGNASARPSPSGQGALIISWSINLSLMGKIGGYWAPSRREMHRGSAGPRRVGDWLQ